jgi:putative inorganic carbon (HCO3(-)) transporter
MALQLERPRWTWLLLAAAAALVGAAAGYDPQLAVAAALAIAFVALILADLTAGLVLFTILAFLALLPTFGGSALSLPKLTGLLLVVSWLATMSSRDGGVPDLFGEHPGVAMLLLAFTGWVGLSVLWSESHGAAASSLSRYALNLFLFPIVYAALRRRRHAVWVAGAFLGGAALAAAYGIVAPPRLPAGAGLANSTALDRVSGTIGDPNELAAVLVAGLVLATALLRLTRGSPANRLAALAGGGVCLFTIFLTLSRGGLVALAVALLAGILAGGRWRATYALVAAVSVLGAVAYFGAIASPQDRDRLTKADGGTGRTDIWKIGWRMFEDKPLAGVGAGNFPATAVHYTLRPGTLRRSDLVVEHPQVTHNIYLQVLAELGIVGLALFLAIVAASLGGALGAARRFREHGDAPMELLCRAVAIATAGLLAADFFLSGQYSKQLWLLLALGVGLRGLADGPRSGASRAPSAA